MKRSLKMRGANKLFSVNDCKSYWIEYGNKEKSLSNACCDFGEVTEIIPYEKRDNYCTAYSMRPNKKRRFRAPEKWVNEKWHIEGKQYNTNTVQKTGEPIEIHSNNCTI